MSLGESGANPDESGLGRASLGESKSVWASYLGLGLWLSEAIQVIWGYLAGAIRLAGAIWVYLAPSRLSGAIWGFLTLSGAIWGCLELCGAIWGYVRPSEAWGYLGQSVVIWGLLGLSGADISDALWDYLKLSGAFGTIRPIWNYLRLSKLPRANWGYRALSIFQGHLVPSVSL